MNTATKIIAFLVGLAFLLFGIAVFFIGFSKHSYLPLTLFFGYPLVMFASSCFQYAFRNEQKNAFEKNHKQTLEQLGDKKSSDPWLSFNGFLGIAISILIAYAPIGNQSGNAKVPAGYINDGILGGLICLVCTLCFCLNWKKVTSTDWRPLITAVRSIIRSIRHPDPSNIALGQTKPITAGKIVSKVLIWGFITITVIIPIGSLIIANQPLLVFLVLMAFVAYKLYVKRSKG